MDVLVRLRVFLTKCMNLSTVGVDFHWISVVFNNRSGYEFCFEGKLTLLFTCSCSFCAGEQQFAPFAQTAKCCGRDAC